MGNATKADRLESRRKLGERCKKRSPIGCVLSIIFLDGLSENVLVFHTSAAVRNALGKKKPAVWVVTEDITRQPDQPWRADKTTPVILLSYCKAADTPIQKADGKLTILTMPVLPKTLRDAVLSHIR